MGVKKNTETEMETEGNKRITESEAALYDRQIRLWGLECQKRLRNSKMLIVGLNGLGLEIVKNLTLTGVGSITIIDNTPVSINDSSAQFYACQAALGQTRSEASKAAIQELNPNVKIEIDAEDISTKSPEFVQNFSVIFVTDCPLNVMIQLNKYCRESKVLFYCGEAWGFYGYGFCDLNDYAYSVFSKVSDTNIKKVRHVGKKLPQDAKTRIEYSSLGACLGAKVGGGLRKRVNKVYILMNVLNQFCLMHKRRPEPQSREEDMKLLLEMKEFTVKQLGLTSEALPNEMLEMSFGELSPVCAVIGGEIANEMIKALSRKPYTLDNFFLFDGLTCTGHVETIAMKD